MMCKLISEIPKIRKNKPCKADSFGLPSGRKRVANQRQTTKKPLSEPGGFFMYVVNLAIGEYDLIDDVEVSYGFWV